MLTAHRCGVSSEMPFELVGIAQDHGRKADTHLQGQSEARQPP